MGAGHQSAEVFTRWVGTKHMSDTFKRRRRRTGSSSIRFKPSQLVPAESIRPGQLGKSEFAACAGVSIVALALIALIWIVTGRAIQEQNIEIRERAEQALIGEAATIAEAVTTELKFIDQSLTILQDAWKENSETFDLLAWQKKMPTLLAVADDLFIADDKRIIRQDILPKAVGQGVGAAYVTFPHGSLEQLQSDGTKAKEFAPHQGQAGAAIDARQYLMYVIRPLDHPNGWLIGASYRSEELTKLFAQGALGFNPVVALVDTRRGMVQAVVGPAARRPKTDLSRTPLFSGITRSMSGTWLGQTAIDDVERLHAFRRIPDRDMSVVVAASWSEIMAPAETLAVGARSLASIGSALVLVIGGIVLWGLYSVRGNRRQKRIFDRTRNELMRLRGEDSKLSANAQMNASRLQAVMDNTVDGIALLDAGLRLVQWNHPFQRAIGIAPRSNMPLDTMLREQAAAGLLGTYPDPETEIARRVAILRTGDAAGVPQPGPAGGNLILRGLPIAEGGFMLLLNGLTSWEPAPFPTSERAETDDAASQPALAAPIEW